MSDLVHIERRHAIRITTWTSWAWTHDHEYEYEHEHESLNGMDKRLCEAYTWNYLGKWYMAIIWAWQGHGGIVVLGIWFARIFMFFNKICLQNDKIQG